MTYPRNRLQIVQTTVVIVAACMAVGICMIQYSVISQLPSNPVNVLVHTSKMVQTLDVNIMQLFLLN
jgi:vancomycin permeability regulator SanA